MSELLHNMSAPPRSEVKFKKEQLKKYIAFNPLHLARLLKKLNYKDEISESVQQYVKNNPGIVKNIMKPTGYMIGEVIKLNGKYKLNQYKYVECDNLELLIIVLCSTVGDLYIPDRPLSFEKTKFNKVLLFPEEEVNS